jgi:antitoxin CcdA
MRAPLYNVNARRKTVSITLNADLVARASALGINISRTAEAAIIEAFEAAEKATILEELREATRMVDEYVAIHGMPPSTTGRTKLCPPMTPIMQHDLYANPNARSRSAFPLVVLQADATEGDTRLIAPLAPHVGPLARTASRALPLIDHDQKR